MTDNPDLKQDALRLIEAGRVPTRNGVLYGVARLIEGRAREIDVERVDRWVSSQRGSAE